MWETVKSCPRGPAGQDLPPSPPGMLGPRASPWLRTEQDTGGRWRWPSSFPCAEHGLALAGDWVFSPATRGKQHLPPRVGED